MKFWRENEPVILLLLGFLGIAICAFAKNLIFGGMVTSCELVVLSLLSYGRGE